jgi:hypothetical protein
VSPTVPLAPLLLAGITGVWTAGFASHALAIRSGSPILAAIPPGALLAFADMLLGDGARPSYAALFLAGALAVLFMDGLRRVRQWGPLRPWPGSRGKTRFASPTATRGARRVTLFALAAALLIPGLLPGFQNPALLRIDTSSVLPGPTVNPLVSVTASLQSQNPQDLFLIRAAQPAYWRWLALDRFDGTRWTTADLDVTHGETVPSGATVPQSPVEGGGFAGKEIDLHQTVVVLKDLPNDPWLPMAFHPLRVSVGRSSIRYSADNSAAVPEVGMQQGLQYTVDSRVLLPTRRQLNAITGLYNPAYRLYEELPGNTPPAIYALARSITADATTPFQKLLAIQDFFHGNGFRYDQRVNGSTDTRSVLNFLTRTRRGFCQQFSTAMAVLARALGFPTRIGVGFTPGRFDAARNAYVVSTENAHAWVEVLFPGLGWMAFEPTPSRDNPIADAYLAPQSAGTRPCELQGTCGAGGKGAKGGSRAAGIRAKATRLRNLERSQTGGPGAVFLPARGATQHSEHPYRLPMLLLGLLLALAAVAFLVLVPLWKLVVRRYRLARAGPPREVALVAFRTFSGRAADLGLGRGQGETLREYQARLRGRIRFSDGHLERLTAITSRAAYAEDGVSPEQAREAVAAARRTIREIRKDTPIGRRIVGVFRPGI